jgi:transmembrane sensor
VKVAVERGAVLVSGETVPDRVVRLGPTQSIVVPLGVAASEGAAPSSSGAVEPAKTARAPSGANAPGHVRSAPAVSSGAAEPTGVASIESPPESEPAVTVQAMLARADEARLAGRYRDAAAILERVVSENGAASQVNLAEFSLGRLYLDSLGDPGAAATHFSRALARGLPGALAEDAYARLVEAYAREGDPKAAREAAERYRARYGNGRRLPDVDRWSAPTP